MRIIGAGMSGLLAAHILRRFNPIIEEAQESLPNNHAALLRFRTDAVSRATGIPFKKVWVQKAICYKGILQSDTNLAFNNMYSAKVTGMVANRSIMNLQPGERFVAPLDFISRMAKGLNIMYGVTVTGVSGMKQLDSPVISTIPMGALMNMVNWSPIPKFNYQAVAILSCDLAGVDIYQTIYYPGNEVSYYRASITGNHLMIEIMEKGHPMSGESCNRIIGKVLDDFGISQPYIRLSKLDIQKYGKIYPMDDSQRKQFILAMTDKFSVYSIGRFATWRNILMDDVVKDVQLVERMIEERTAYASHLPTAV